MKSVNVVYEICDLDTGEIVFKIRQKTFIVSDGIRNIRIFLRKFYDLCQSGGNYSINISCFDSRYNIYDAENIFIRNKHIEGIF